MHELNELTLYDIVILRSTVDIIYNPSYQCNVCVRKMSESVRESRKGCTGKTKVRKPVIEGVFYTQCPGNFYNPAYAQLLDVHRLFRKGVLAFEGGLMDQPSKYLDAMNLLENLITEKEIEQTKKSMKNGRKQSSR